MVQRHELRYQGDGVHNNTHRAVLDAIEEKKRPVVAVYGPAGCGKSCLLARIVKYMHKVEADKAQKLREEAEAAKSKKKKAVAPKPATGGGGGDKKKKDMGPAMLPAQTCLVSFFVSPWHSLRDCLMFVLQEVLGPVASEQFLHQHPDRESILRETVYGKDLEMRQRMSECTDAEVLGVFCEGLEAFFNAGLNRTVGLVLDGFGLDGCDQATGQTLLGRSQVPSQRRTLVGFLWPLVCVLCVSVSMGRCRCLWLWHQDPNVCACQRAGFRAGRGVASAQT